jgi:ankyrin repeat protein
MPLVAALPGLFDCFSNMAPTLTWYMEIAARKSYPRWQMSINVLTLTDKHRRRTALQFVFLRGRLDTARAHLMKGADIEHVDEDGYSVLSFLWVIDKSLVNARDFMRLWLTNEFSGVNSCDSRGRSAFRRAAPIGAAEDVEAFLQLGGSLDLRADWYGLTALFFATPYDNMATFQALVRRSPGDVYESLDGDGWTLLHCCVYFGATSAMRELLRKVVDVN